MTVQEKINFHVAANSTLLSERAYLTGRLFAFHIVWSKIMPGVRPCTL